jgi:hypothetical protein
MYKVFGFDWDFKEFEYEFDSFVKAVIAYRQLSFTTVFITRDKPGSCLFVH